jgi:hypothetical protein
MPGKKKGGGQRLSSSAYFADAAEEDGEEVAAVRWRGPLDNNVHHGAVGQRQVEELHVCNEAHLSKCLERRRNFLETGSKGVVEEGKRTIVKDGSLLSLSLAHKGVHRFLPC